MRFPVELGAEISTGHVLALTAGPLLVVDTIVQDRLYASSSTSVTTVGGVSLGAYYRYAVSEAHIPGLRSCRRHRHVCNSPGDRLSPVRYRVHAARGIEGERQ